MAISLDSFCSIPPAPALPAAAVAHRLLEPAAAASQHPSPGAAGGGEGGQPAAEEAMGGADHVTSNRPAAMYSSDDVDEAEASGPAAGPRPKTAQARLSELGGLLFTRNCSGSRVVTGCKTETVRATCSDTR